MRSTGVRTLLMALSIASAAAALTAQAPAGQIFDETVPPGQNFDKAEFRLWLPPDTKTIEAMVVLVPGSNGDGRGQVNDAPWQAFATKHHLALVGVRLTDKPHDQNFIEHYIDVKQGSGQAFLDALSTFATKAKHPELAAAPLLLWGMSAGGEFNYEFTAWKPERVVAFVVNKGGIYYTALSTKGARDVPGILFVGGKDLEFRTNTIVGLFAVNRRAGALWALAEEPAAGHIVGRSRDVAERLFEDVMAMRLDPPGADGAPKPLKAIAAGTGFIGDFKAKTFAPVTGSPNPSGPTAWLPTERVAKAWQAMVTEQPFSNLEILGFRDLEISGFRDLEILGFRDFGIRRQDK